MVLGSLELQDAIAGLYRRVGVSKLNPRGDLTPYPTTDGDEFLFLFGSGNVAAGELYRWGMGTSRPVRQLPDPTSFQSNSK